MSAAPELGIGLVQLVLLVWSGLAVALVGAMIATLVKGPSARG